MASIGFISINLVFCKPLTTFCNLFETETFVLNWDFHIFVIPSKCLESLFRN